MVGRRLRVLIRSLPNWNPSRVLQMNGRMTLIETDSSRRAVWPKTRGRRRRTTSLEAVLTGGFSDIDVTNDV